ncbi:hypothetical protein LTR95_006282 [Oleoguttula sp. CCFEE 5521]
MPAVPGESLLTTLFADVHYYFSDPSAKPVHHRFSKGSYVYLYHNAAESRSKLEIANHAGTPDQDAFHGMLSNVSSIRYSHKQPALFTVTVNAAAVQTQQEWHLPSFNERNEQKYLYKIQAIDVYLWTEKDAAHLLRHLQSVLPADKLDVRDAPPAQQAALPEHGSSMSPVVQQLERTAIGAHFPPRAESTTSTHSFSVPPTPASNSAKAPSPLPLQQQQQAPTPLAYNPAAPSAPEPIAYREKTPPPPEENGGAGSYTGHPTTQYASAPQAYNSSLQNTPQGSYFPGPPQLQQQRQSSIPNLPGPPSTASPAQAQRIPSSGGLPPPPPPPTGGPSPLHQHPSFGPPPTSSQPISPPPTQQSFNRQSIYSGVPTQQFASYPSQPHAPYAPSPGFGPSIQSQGLQSPGFPAYNNAQQPQPHQQQQPPTPSAPPAYGIHTPLQSPGFSPQPQPQQQHQQPQHFASQHQAAQIAGYSSYSYTTSSIPGQQGQQQGYDLHAQLYRPTGPEASHGAKPGVVGVGQGGGVGVEGGGGKYKVNERVDRVEKGVGRFLKKLDSKW